MHTFFAWTALIPGGSLRERICSIRWKSRPALIPLAFRSGTSLIEARRECEHPGAFSNTAGDSGNTETATRSRKRRTRLREKIKGRRKRQGIWPVGSGYCIYRSGKQLRHRDTDMVYY